MSFFKERKFSFKLTIMKVGIIVTIHWSDIRPQGGMFLKKYLESLQNDIPKYNYCVYIIDNQSEFDFTIPNNFDYKYTYVKDQTIEGLTGAWNLGIDQAFNDGCDLIINTNDDLTFNNTLNYFIEDITNSEHKNSAIFGPRTNKAPKEHPNGLPPESSTYTILNVKDGSLENVLYGFCFAFTKEVYEVGKISSSKFFPYEHKMSQGLDHWGSQEGYFSILSSKGIKNILCNRAFFKHVKLESWMIHHKLYDYNTKSRIKDPSKAKTIL